MMLGTAVLPLTMAAQQRPNIIYIMTDQQCSRAMSCAGNTDLKTPAMDRLAANGVRFTNAYCTFPLSGPSRSGMFTGLYPSETGMNENDIPMPEELKEESLGCLVRDTGYDCVYAGKWHCHTLSIPNDEFGFTNIHDNGDQGLAEACVDWLRHRDRKQPFFMVASYINPHNICEYARSQRTPHARVEPANLEDCPNLPDNFAVAPYDATVLQFEKEQNYALYPTMSYGKDDWRKYRNAYNRLVEAVDAEIGKIVDEIDRQNLWKNTVIIFTSDHGDGNGAHQWNQKTALYEEVACVPLIVCAPGKKNAGTVTEALVNSGIDLLPSICDWTGAKVPARRQGKSYRPVVEKGAAQVQDYVVTETNFNQTGRSIGWIVRTPKYKYILYDKGQYREQLFDMENDRGEMVNLAVESKYQEEVERHRAMLVEWLESHPGPNRARHMKFIPETY